MNFADASSIERGLITAAYHAKANNCFALYIRGRRELHRKSNVRGDAGSASSYAALPVESSLRTDRAGAALRSFLVSYFSIAALTK